MIYRLYHKLLLETISYSFIIPSHFDILCKLCYNFFIICRPKEGGLSMVRITSQYLTPDMPIGNLSALMSLCHANPGSSTSKRNATKIISVLDDVGVKTIGQFMSRKPSFFDGLDGLGHARLQMLIECYEYLHASGICWE